MQSDLDRLGTTHMAFPELLYRPFWNGSPRLWHVQLFFRVWLTPQGLRRQLRGLFQDRADPPAAQL